MTVRSAWPKWEDLSEASRGRLNNGVGPEWLPQVMRGWLTKIGEMFFVEAEWAHHDYGYWKGELRKDRARCDWLFFAAMLNDAARLSLHKRVLAIGVSCAFWAAVRLGGWASFAWGPQEPPIWIFD
jgi:hypothetical protein